MAAIEFAAVLPLLSMMLVGAVEYSTALGRQVDLEQSAQRAVELALVRPPTANTAAALAHIRTEAESASGQSGTNVTVELYRECNGAKQTTFGVTCATGERQADFVQVEIVDTYTWWLNWRGLMGGAPGAAPILRGQAHARVA